MSCVLLFCCSTSNKCLYLGKEVAVPALWAVVFVRLQACELQPGRQRQADPKEGNICMLLLFFTIKDVYFRRVASGIDILNC